MKTKPVYGFTSEKRAASLNGDNYFDVWKRYRLLNIPITPWFKINKVGLYGASSAIRVMFK